MRFPFRALPAAAGGQLTPRPVIDVWLEGLDVAPVESLIDTGALRTRFAAELAEVAGVDLDGAPRERFAVGGAQVEGAMARVTLRVAQGGQDHRWDAPVWFCRPWPFGFQLLGLEGFLHHFRLTVCAYEEWLECEPEG